MSMGSLAAVRTDDLDIAAEARGAERIRPQYRRRVAALPFDVGLTDVSPLRQCVEKLQQGHRRTPTTRHRTEDGTAHRAVKFDRYGGVGRTPDTRGSSLGGRADLDDGNPDSQAL
jgi:hypothetical protein